jgi:ribonuclease P protein component
MIDMDQRADKRYRVTSRRDVARLFERGRRSADGVITMYAFPNESPDAVTRAAVGVSKRHGSAVRRNHIKRLCREAFRLSRAELPAGWDFMIIPRAGADHTLVRLQRSVKYLARKLAAAGGPGGPE